MLRSFVTGAFRAITTANSNRQIVHHAITPLRQASSLVSNNFSICQSYGLNSFISRSLLEPSKSLISQERSVTKFSLNKGKRKSVKAVVKRFKRLDWGCWIRTHSGRHKKLFKKSPALRRRLRQHLLVNATQSWLLDKMVTSFWRRPKHYIDDPYAPYHKREEYWATKKKPIGM